MKRGLLVFALALAAVAAAPAGDVQREPAALAICRVFGDGHCGQALRVSWCESRWQTSARNGQYLGVFQMGAWERRTYGHGATVGEQARAAYRYFLDTGRSWRPWECKP